MTGWTENLTDWTQFWENDDGDRKGVSAEVAPGGNSIMGLGLISANTWETENIS